VFKAKSPSCGIRAIPRYREGGVAADHAGRGLYAARVLSAFPLLAVEDEGRLNDPGLREAFVERIFAAARLRGLLASEWTAGDLVSFHARHKLQLLAHDPARYRAAGKVVAGAGTAPRSVISVAYADLFLAALARPATAGRNANALQHAYSRIGRELDRPRRADLLARIEAYRRGEEPLSVPVALLAHYASGGDFPWLAEQTYLSPFPAGLGLRHAVGV
jgi:uncharacterized protein YbgA (DUF1722 family)